MVVVLGIEVKYGKDGGVVEFFFVIFLGLDFFFWCWVWHEK